MVKHKCDLGVFLTRQEPTKQMLKTVIQTGYFEAPYGYKYPKLQIMTLTEFFSGKQLNLPKENVTFKRAKTIGKNANQNSIFE